MKAITRLLLTAFLLLLPAMPAVIVTVQPSVSNVDVGQSFSVDIAISNLSDLYAWQFDLGFDPTQLNATGITEGPFLSTAGSTIFIAGTIDNPGGAISSTAATLQTAIPGATGSGILATANFLATGAGNAQISIFNVQLLDSNLFAIDNSTQDGSVTISTAPISSAPEANSLWLVAFAFGAFALRKSISWWKGHSALPF